VLGSKRMDPTITAGGITAVSGLLNVLKTITGIAKDVNNVELNRQISEIQMKVFEVQEKLMSLQDENMRLRDENGQLKASAELQNRVVFHDHANWERLDNGSEEGPFCPSCWTDGKLRRAQINQVYDGEVQFACTQHKTTYYFPVPERLVKIGDLSSYKQSGVSYSAEDVFHGGPDGWMAR
jgi:regulator of replication initiation timing